MIVSCTLTVPTGGTAFVRAGGSAWRRDSVVQGSDGFAGGFAEVVRSPGNGGSPFDLVGLGARFSLRPDLGDGTDRNISLQAVSAVEPGIYSFGMAVDAALDRDTVVILNPSVTAFFVPSGGDDIVVCTSPEYAAGILDVFSGDEKAVVECSIDGPAPGHVQIFASSWASAVPGSDRFSVLTRLKLDSEPLNTAAPEVSTALTQSRSSIEQPYPGSVPAFDLTQMRSVAVDAGTHTFTLSARSGSQSLPYRLTGSYVFAFFIPDSSPDFAQCADSNPSSSAAGTAATIVVSCTIELARPAAVQLVAGGNPRAFGHSVADGGYTGVYDLMLDGHPVPTSTRYLDIYGVAPDGDQALTMTTEALVDAQAGTHVVSFRMKRLDPAGADITIESSWITARALLDEPAAMHVPIGVTVPTSMQSAEYVAVAPERLLDTRVGNSAPTADSTLQLRVTSVGTSNVPRDAKAVVLNVTGTEAIADGYVTVWPCGQTRPTASNLNVRSGVTVSNLVVSAVGDGGKVCLYTLATEHLIADIVGYMPYDSGVSTPTPRRLLDTRPASRTGHSGTKPNADSITRLHVADRGSTVPNSTAAVVLNITGTESASNGYVTVWPCGDKRPTASNLNLVASGDRSNLVLSAVGDGGDVCIYTQIQTHLIADLSATLQAGGDYTPTAPQRILETRPPNQVGYSGVIPRPDGIIQVHVVGAGTPMIPANASAVVLNVTGTEAVSDGFVTVWPCGAPRPTASNLNLTVGGTSANLVMSEVGVGGNVCIYTQAGAHLVADLAGYWGSAD